jgi:hypothetical protein
VLGQAVSIVEDLLLNSRDAGWAVISMGIEIPSARAP